MNLQSKFGYCMTTQTLNIALCTGQNYAQTDGQTEKRTIQTLDAPGGPFRPGALKKIDNWKIHNKCMYCYDSIFKLLQGF